MTKINFGRLFVGGLIASVLLFLSDGLLHEQVFKQYWEYLYQGLGARPPESPHAMAMVYFFIFELGRGFLAIFLYVLMRPFHGPGPKTAVLSAIAAWLAFSALGCGGGSSPAGVAPPSNPIGSRLVGFNDALRGAAPSLVLLAGIGPGVSTNPGDWKLFVSTNGVTFTQSGIAPVNTFSHSQVYQIGFPAADTHFFCTAKMATSTAVERSMSRLASRSANRSLSRMIVALNAVVPTHESSRGCPWGLNHVLAWTELLEG